MRRVARAGLRMRPHVYTFDPPPRVVLAPEHHRPRIQPWTDRVQELGKLGIEHVILERFTRAFAQHPPEWFIEQILNKRIQPIAIVVGYDFRFGQDRREILICFVSICMV